ncbi:MAG TPA: membrane protein insertase YidC, partial [Gemmatimonadaceae bacterium]
MDKRFFLFLALAAAVLLITPRLFPPTRTPPSGTSRGDTTASHRAVDTARGRAAAAPSVSAPAATSAATAAPQAVAATLDTAQAQAGPGDTIAVRTKRVVYRFSTVGAALTGSELLDYKALSKGDGPVQLARPGSRLVGYQLLVGGRDTVRLDRMPFTVDSSALARTGGAGSLTFRTSAAGSTVAITYTFSPDSYLVHVRGSVQGGTAQNRRLLITLPNGLHSEEADTVDDQRHFAYVVKPVRDDARSISFTKLEPEKAATQAGPLEWVASKSKYFVLALFADTTVAPFSDATMWLRPDSASKVARTADAVVGQPVGANGTFAFDLYTGPQEWRRLLALGHGFQNVNPYGGFFRAIVQPFATIVMRVLLWMHDHLRINYGWVLIIFGVAVRLILWPLN